MTKPFDPTKPVQTRDGRPARIICTDRKGRRPIGALVGDDDEVVWTMKDGVFNRSERGCEYDLINIPTKVTKYAVMVNDSALLNALYDVAEAADFVGRNSGYRDVYRVVTVTWEE